MKPKRNYTWRKWKQDLKIRKRLNRYTYCLSWWKFEDVNGDEIENPQIKDFIGKSIYFKSKTTSIGKPIKKKFSKVKGAYRYGRDDKKREKLKQDLIKIRKQYGL